MHIWQSTYTWRLKTTGPDKIILREKRVEGKIQKILNSKGHAPKRGAYRNRLKKSGQRDMCKYRIVPTQKTREKKAFQDRDGKC